MLKLNSSLDTEISSTTKKTAADELSHLSDKFSNYSFVAASYTKGMSKWAIVQKDDKKSHLQTMSENAAVSKAEDNAAVTGLISIQ